MTPPAVATPTRTGRERARPVPRRATPTHPRRPTRPPRRVSGPARGRGATVSVPGHSRPLGARALAIVRGLPEHSLIDRLVRSRAWIPVLGVLLAGIVAMQVEILKLGTTIGHSMERSSALQSQDESLQASVASLADDQRIEKLAAAMGMVTPSPTSVVFLNAHPGGDAGRALANIHAPDAAGFAALLADQAAAAAAMLPGASAGPTSNGSISTIPGTAGSPAAPAAAPSGSAPAAAPATSTSSGATAAPASGAVSASPVSSGSSTASSQPSAPTQPTSSSAAATGAAGIAPSGSTQSAASTGG